MCTGKAEMSLEEVSPNNQQILDNVLELIDPSNSNDQIVSNYNSWAETYDCDVEKRLSYHGAEIGAKYMDIYCKTLGIKHDARIIDIAAGTGLCGKQLSEKYNFTNLDALDGSEGMLKQAAKLGIYKKSICAMLGNSHTLSVKSETYGGAIISGALVPGHLDETCFPEIIRIVKPGGLIVNAMRKSYLSPGGGLENMMAACEELAKQGKWKVVDIIVPQQMKMALDHDAIVFAFQV